MAQRIPIRLHGANALQWLGTLYRNPADALKEHVSNAIDEHLKAKLRGDAHDRCDVTFTLDRRHVTIDDPYGMSRTEISDQANETTRRRRSHRRDMRDTSFRIIAPFEEPPSLSNTPVSLPEWVDSRSAPTNSP